jgi:hypothetical protein
MDVTVEASPPGFDTGTGEGSSPGEAGADAPTTGDDASVSSDGAGDDGDASSDDGDAPGDDGDAPGDDGDAPGDDGDAPSADGDAHGDDGDAHGDDGATDAESGTDATLTDAGPQADAEPDSGVAETGGLDAADGAVDTGSAEAGDASVEAGDASIAESGTVDAEAGTHDATTDTGVGEAGGSDGSSATACDPVSGSTRACLMAQEFRTTGMAGGPCLQCALQNNCLDPANGGGLCEDPSLAKAATVFGQALPDGKKCSGVVAPPATEKSICLQTLGQVFSSTCAATLQETPCLCGATDVNMCTAGTAPPTGALYDVYACDFNSTNGATIYANITVLTFGSGMANAIIQCAAAFSCECF